MKQLDQFDFHSVIGATRGPALVIFTAPACGSCRHWKRLLSEYGSHHSGLSLFEVDAARDLALVREFEVFHLPALFLFNDGEYHCALEAQARPHDLAQALDIALSRPAEEAP